MPLEAGDSLGSYQLESRLGEGGMGEVWKAYDPTLRRTVAIKVLKHQASEAAGRVLAEARAASALNHAHICTIYEVGEAGPSTPSTGSGQAPSAGSEPEGSGQAVSFIVMEHVEGRALATLIPRDGLPPETVIRYGSQIAAALAHAHEHGIVHRDLKSANVVITPDAQVKLIDFGIAVPLPHADADAVTRTMESPVGHAPMGTLAFMAPEILNGEEATARSDIWSLGVLLYEMASGGLPFEGDTPLDVVSAIARESPRTLPTRVPAGLRSVIQRCVQKEPGSRYSSAAVVQGALEILQSDAGTSVPAASASSGTPRTWWIAAAILILLAGVGYLVRSRAQPVAPDVLRLTNPTQITRAIGDEMNPAWSPDGRMLAYDAGTGAGSNDDIWITQIGGGQAVNRTTDHAGTDRWPSWSPDGTQIAFYSNRDGDGIYVTPTLGGPARKVLDRVIEGRPQWSPDGTELAGIVTGDDEQVAIEIVSLQGREPRRLSLSARLNRDLSWSPNGRYFALVEAVSYEAEVTRLWVLRASDGAQVPVTDGRTAVWSPSWSPDGATLYFVTNRDQSMDLWQQRLTQDGEVDGPPARVTTGIGMRHAALSPDGARLAYTRGSRIANAWRVPILPDRPATWDDAEQLTFDQAFIELLDVSPDGGQLFVSSDRSGNQDIWRLPAGGGEMQQLTSDPTPDWGPHLSPDGETIAFYSYRSGNRDIWVMPARGGPARQMTVDEGDDLFPHWSPDGRSIAFSSSRSGSLDIWLMSADGGEPRQLTVHPSRELPAAWSPDGRRFAFVSFQAGPDSGVWHVGADGGVAERFTNDATGVFHWTPDGDLLYPAPDGTIRQASLDGSRERTVVQLEGKPGSLYGQSLASDGRHIYFSWREHLGDIWMMDVASGEQ